MVWFVRYRPRGKVVYQTAPDAPPPVVTPIVPPVSIPVFSVVPTITGSPAVGQTLTATTGAASGSPSYALQWRRNGSPISGAMSATYVVQAADQGTALTVASSASNSAGVTVAVSAALSIPAAPVVVPAPVFSAAPVITGTPTEGQTLSTTTGTASGSPTYALQWKRNGTNISGATGSTYALVSADVGATITVTSTATNAGGSVSSTSTATATIAALPVSGGATTLNSAWSAPTLLLVSANADGSSPAIDIDTTDVPDVSQSPLFRIESRDRDGNVTGTFTNTIDAAEAAARSANFGLAALGAGTRRFFGRYEQGGQHSPWSPMLLVGPDDIAPVLTNLSSVQTGTTSGKALFTTDTGEGTARVVFRLSTGTPAQSTMDASTNTLAITTAGAKEVPVTGLTAATLYYAWVQHTDATGNKSPITAAGSFTTQTPAAFSIAEVAGPATVTPSSGNTATFSGLNLGATDPQRSFLVLINNQDGDSLLPGPVTLAGVPLEFISGSKEFKLSAWKGLVPNGTTGDLQITAGQHRVTAKVIRVVGAGSFTALAPLSLGFRGDPMQLSVATPAGGAVALMATIETIAGTGVWTNAAMGSEVKSDVSTYTSGIRTAAGTATVNLAGYGSKTSYMIAIGVAP